MFNQRSEARRTDREASYYQPDYRRTQEMGLTPEQFGAGLPSAVTGRIERDGRSGTVYAVITDGCVAVISVEALPDRQIGALTIPVSQVDIEFYGHSVEQRKEFMRCFDLAYLRMGG